MTRDFSLEDLARYRQGHQDQAPLVIPVAGGGSHRHFGFVDAVAVVVNRDNPLEALSYAQLDAIFSSSRLHGHTPVLTWGELGVQAWADKPVHVVGAGAWRQEESARATVFRDRVLSTQEKRGSWRRQSEGRQDSEAQVPEHVAADTYAIGITGMGHLVPEIKPLAIATSEFSDPIAPTHEQVALARYPLARQLHLVLPVSDRQQMEAGVFEWVRFLLSREAQEAVREQGVYLPLREAQRQESLRILQRHAPVCPTE